MIRAVLLDIEGTTSSLAFVRERLFPYAREHLGAFVAERRGDEEIEGALREVVRLAREEGRNDEEPVSSLERWMEQDSKAAPLKALQGLLWESAFQRGLFVAHVYPEVPEVLARLREQGLELYVYSSGSVRAQRAFFRHSSAGDLTPLIAGWFDTRVGKKSDAASYLSIARALGRDPEEITFLSDSPAELDAARAAGLSTVGLLRGPHELKGHPAATRFDELPLAALSTGGARAGHDAVGRAKDRVIELARHCYERGWATATSGNFSVRVAAERIAITASGVDKGRLTPREVLLLDHEGEPLEPGTPSAEAPLHVALYRGAPEIAAVAHTHSVAATVLSRHFAGRGALRLAGYEMAKALGPARKSEPPELVLPIIENGQDARALSEVVRERLERTPALAYLVEGHGLTTWGRDAGEVFRRVEALEFMLACELARFTAGALSWRSAG
jgi:2,3-diketo-5-methylthio-1-phosphopentane phosphatase/methylthioribulose-1-phosphate dehydratase